MSCLPLPAGVPAAGMLRPGTLASCTRLVNLSLAYTGTAMFPQEVLMLSGSLRSLDLTGNKITSLPEDVARLTK